MSRLWLGTGRMCLPWQAQRWATMRRTHWRFHGLAATGASAGGASRQPCRGPACYASTMALILAYSRWLRFSSFSAFYFAPGVPLGLISIASPLGVKRFLAWGLIGSAATGAS